MNSHTRGKNIHLIGINDVANFHIERPIRSDQELARSFLDSHRSRRRRSHGRHWWNHLPLIFAKPLCLLIMLEKKNSGVIIRKKENPFDYCALSAISWKNFLFFFLLLFFSFLFGFGVLEIIFSFLLILGYFLLIWLLI